MSDTATTPKTPAAAPKNDRDRDREARESERTNIRARIATHTFVLRVQQANGTSVEQKRDYAVSEAVKDADALIKALGL